MKKIKLLLLFLFPLFIWGQNLPFEQAYLSHPGVPDGVLESVSWASTRMDNIDETYAPSCIGMPLPYGVMGVFDDGANYFKENGKLIAQLSNISVEQQKSDIAFQIKAYAAAFENLYLAKANLSENKRIYNVLIELSEIPDSGRINLYARDAQVFERMRFLNDEEFAQTHGFAKKKLNLEQVFGSENLEVLSAVQVNFTETGIETDAGVAYMPSTENSTKSVGYGPALWVPTPTCNYSSRNASISAITIHTAQGSYGGTISWAQNCQSNVSYHYVLRSSDGQITQMLKEVHKGWHVGNENPYTIGYEHEGYVNNSSWYTNAMYTTSAALTKHITTKPYDSRVKPVRTYYGASSSGTKTLGECTRIKGHQHYAGQSHTDPGIHWDWEKYYKLVNSPGTVTTITSASGNFYDSGGASGNYGNDERKLWLFAPTDVSSLTINFTSFNLEANWDHMFIYDGTSTNSPLIGKYTGTNGPGTVTSNSGKILVEFRSDCATGKPGWKANYTSVPNTPPDNIAPTTAITIPSGWKTTDFDAEFTDADETGGSGLSKSFYQVLYFDGTSWKANPNNGFFGDNFDGPTIDNNWTSKTGTWGISSNKRLEQTDISVGNSNIYAPLDQNLSNRYLYTWNGRIGGTDENRRAGFHFLCDDATKTERGNSYLVYFRAGGNSDPNNNNKVQIYKSSGNVLSLEKSVSYAINAGQWYEYKVVFDRVTGEMFVYVDDNLAATWTDSNPHDNGNSVSFRSGSSNYRVDNFKAYRTRYPDVTVTVGPGTATDIPVQNPDPNTPAAKVKSIVMDNAGNLSDIAQELVNVDWSIPESLVIMDGPGADIDTIHQSTIEGNWGTANDPHSGIVEYKVAVGTTEGGEEVMAYTSNAMSEVISHVLSNPVYNQIYYISVKAENGAGLIATASSDGQRYVNQSSLGIVGEELNNIMLYPNPAVDNVNFKHLDTEVTVLIYDAKGQLVRDTELSPSNHQINVSEFSAGTYSVVIQKDNQMMVKKLIKH